MPDRDPERIRAIKRGVRRSDQAILDENSDKEFFVRRRIRGEVLPYYFDQRTLIRVERTPGGSPIRFLHGRLGEAPVDISGRRS